VCNEILENFIVFSFLLVYSSYLYSSVCQIRLHCVALMTDASGGSTHSSIGEQKVTLVFFLGGVTFAEVSALRFLAQLEDGNLQFHDFSCRIYVFCTLILFTLQFELKCLVLSSFEFILVMHSALTLLFGCHKGLACKKLFQTFSCRSLEYHC